MADNSVMSELFFLSDIIANFRLNNNVEQANQMSKNYLWLSKNVLIYTVIELVLSEYTIKKSLFILYKFL
jgi:hypothetical protein